MSLHNVLIQPSGCRLNKLLLSLSLLLLLSPAIAENCMWLADAIVVCGTFLISSVYNSGKFQGDNHT